MFRPDGFGNRWTVEAPERQAREQRESCPRKRFEEAEISGNQKAQRSQQGYEFQGIEWNPIHG